MISRRTISNRRGNAYVEFGLLCPLLVMTLGSVADFGLSVWSRARLSDAVSNGAEYAAVVGPGVSGTNVQSAVTSSVTPLSGVSVTVTGPACYCVSASSASNPATLTYSSAYTSGTCTGTCPNATPGVFVQISATYTYSPLMPFYQQFASTTLTENAVVRLQ